MEFWVNLCLLAASAAVLKQCANYTKTIDYALPVISAAGIIIVVLLLMIRNRKKYIEGFKAWKARSGHKPSRETQMMLISVALAGLYALAMSKFNFYLVSFVYLAVSYIVNYLMLYKRGERLKPILIRMAISLVICVLMYVIFRVLLHVNVGV